MAQRERVERKLMACWYNNFGADSTKAKEYIADYTNYLLNEGWLADDTPKSHIKFLETVANGQSLDHRPSKSFLVGLENMLLNKSGNFNECRELAIRDTLRYDSSKLKKTEAVFDSIIRLDGYSRADLAEGLLSVLDEDDFILEYYRIRAFLIYNFIILHEIFDLKLPEQVEDESFDSEKALKIYLDKNASIYVENERIKVERLKKIVETHALKYKSKSMIMLNTDDEILYSDYLFVYNAISDKIQSLRNEYAKSQYKTEFEELPDSLANEIATMFPIKIIE